MRNGGRKKVFENGKAQNKSIKEKAKIYGYDMSNPITAAVLSHGHRTGPDSSSITGVGGLQARWAAQFPLARRYDVRLSTLYLDFCFSSNLGNIFEHNAPVSICFE